MTHRFKSAITTPGNIFSTFIWLMEKFRDSSQCFGIYCRINPLWCRKNVLTSCEAIHMCLKTKRTLLIEAPATSTPKLSKIFPAGNFPNIRGWDDHLNALLPQLGQYCSTAIIEQFFRETTDCSATLHLRQKIENNVIKQEQNTRNLGSFAFL